MFPVNFLIGNMALAYLNVNKPRITEIMESELVVFLVLLVSVLVLVLSILSALRQPRRVQPPSGHKKTWTYILTNCFERKFYLKNDRGFFQLKIPYSH